MPITGQQLVEWSREEWKRQNTSAQMDLYDRLQDHADADFRNERYFPKSYGETQQRYQKRPKEWLPICASALDVMAGATIGDGLEVTIEDDASNEVYQEIAEHNGLHLDFALALAMDAGTYGWCAEKIIPGEIIEFERVTPQNFQPIYDSGAMGASVKRLQGVTFATVYDLDEQSILPRNTSISGSSSKFKRLEVIGPDIWHVYLDGEMVPVDPSGALDAAGDPLRWMPRDDGTNPYGRIPVTLLWNLHRSRAFEGRSDIDPGYKIAEQINRTYSQMLYTLQMYFPTLTTPRGDGSQSSMLTQGIGYALEFDGDNVTPSYITPTIDVEVFLKPLRNMLNLFFSAVHTPASSHGLGAVFGEAQSAESGKAKFYEFNRLQRHAEQKRRNFEAFCRARWQNLAAVLNASKPEGHGKSVNANANVDIRWRSDIVPVSAEEIEDRIMKKMEKGLISQIEGIMQARGWNDDDKSRVKAQAVIDEIGAAATATQAREPESAIERALRGVEV